VGPRTPELDAAWDEITLRTFLFLPLQVVLKGLS